MRGSAKIRRVALGLLVALLVPPSCTRGGSSFPQVTDGSGAKTGGPAPEPLPARPSAATTSVPDTPTVAATVDPGRLADHVHAPVSVVEAIELGGHAIAVFRYNSLDAHFGGLDQAARERAKGRFEAARAACDDERAAEPSDTDDDFERQLLERRVPCEVVAARAVRERPPAKDHGKGPERLPDDVSPRCDRLGIARLDERGTVLHVETLTAESCLQSVEPLALRDFTGTGPQVEVVYTEAVYSDLLGGWGWGLDSDETTLEAFDPRPGGLASVLSWTLESTTYLETELKNVGYYRIDSPGVVTLYWEDWNGDGLQVEQMRWDSERQAWGETQALPATGGVPDDAWPRAR